MSEDMEQLRAKIAAEKGAAEDLARRIAKWAMQIDKEVEEAEKSNKPLPHGVRAHADDAHDSEDHRTAATSTDPNK